MARIRTIKPGFWQHERLSELPEATHLLAAALLNYADDDGYFNANPGLIKAACCPLREPSVSIHDSLTHLSNIGYVRFGTGADGRRYGQIIKFSEHQRINRKIDSKIKEICIVWEASHTTHTQLTELFPPEKEGNRKGNKEGELEKEGNGIIARADARAAKKANGKADSTPTWEAYNIAYHERYGVEATRNARANALLKRFVALVPLAEAPAVADWYVRSNRSVYVGGKHPLTLLVRDAEAIRTEWLTATHGTDTQARQADKKSNMGQIAQKLLREIEDGTWSPGTCSKP